MLAKEMSVGWMEKKQPSARAFISETQKLLLEMLLENMWEWADWLNEWGEERALWKIVRACVSHFAPRLFFARTSGRKKTKLLPQNYEQIRKKVFILSAREKTAKLIVNFLTLHLLITTPRSGLDPQACQCKHSRLPLQNYRPLNFFFQSTCTRESTGSFGSCCCQKNRVFAERWLRMQSVGRAHPDLFLKNSTQIVLCFGGWILSANRKIKF